MGFLMGPGVMMQVSQGIQGLVQELCHISLTDAGSFATREGCDQLPQRSTIHRLHDEVPQQF